MPMIGSETPRTQTELVLESTEHRAFLVNRYGNVCYQKEQVLLELLPSARTRNTV